MSTTLSTTLSALLGVALLAGAAGVRAEPPAGDSPQAFKERCRADPQACREQARQRARERFRQLDADGDGALSRAEAEQGAPKLARRFDALDADGDGRLSQDELRAARGQRAPRRGPGGAS